MTFASRAWNVLLTARGLPKPKPGPKRKRLWLPLYNRTCRSGQAGCWRGLARNGAASSSLRDLAFVPEGHPIIARRFNAGIGPQTTPVPKGRSKTKGRFGRPSGACTLLATGPNVKTFGNKAVPNLIALQKVQQMNHPASK